MLQMGASLYPSCISDGGDGGMSLSMLGNWAFSATSILRSISVVVLQKHITLNRIGKLKCPQSYAFDKRVTG